MRNYRIWGAGARGEIAAALTNVLHGWSADWLTGDAAGLRIAVVDPMMPSETVPGPWLVLGSMETSPLALGCGSNWKRDLLNAMSGLELAKTDDASLLIAAWMEHALGELMARILAQAGQPGDKGKPVWQDAGPTDNGRPGGGQLSAEWRIGDSGRFHLYLSPELAADLRGARTTRHPQALPPVTRTEVVKGRPVALTVIAGRAELSLAELHGLAVSDVLRLDRRLDEPLETSLDDGKKIGRCYLGSLGAVRAIQFTST